MVPVHDRETVDLQSVQIAQETIHLRHRLRQEEIPARLRRGSHLRQNPRHRHQPDQIAQEFEGEAERNQLGPAGAELADHWFGVLKRRRHLLKRFRRRRIHLVWRKRVSRWSAGQSAKNAAIRQLRLWTSQKHRQRTHPVKQGRRQLQNMPTHGKTFCLDSARKTNWFHAVEHPGVNIQDSEQN